MADELLDSLIIFVLCFVWGLVLFFNFQLIVSVLVILAIQGFFLYVDNNSIRRALVLLFSALCLFFPLLCIFIPTLLYAAWRSKLQFWFLPVLIPVFLAFELIGYTGFAAMGVSSIVVGLLVIRSQHLSNLKNRFYNLQDESRLLHAHLEARQRQLLEQQDTEIHLATLNERNRIARDIHDNVGHLLSSALLQTAALQAGLQPRDQERAGFQQADKAGEDLLIRNNFSEALRELQATLDQGMTSIRNSVHQLHEASIDVEQYIHRLLAEFSFCKTECSIDVYSEPEGDLKYALIAIVKESLSNVMRHSHAGLFTLRLKEHPGFYQLVLENDGVEPSSEKSESQRATGVVRGIGLGNIQDRVESMGGQFRISRGRGFRLFLTLPKQHGGQNED